MPNGCGHSIPHHGSPQPTAEDKTGEVRWESKLAGAGQSGPNAFRTPGNREVGEWMNSSTESGVVNIFRPTRTHRRLTIWPVLRTWMPLAHQRQTVETAGRVGSNSAASANEM